MGVPTANLNLPLFRTGNTRDTSVAHLGQASLGHAALCAVVTVGNPQGVGAFRRVGVHEVFTQAEILLGLMRTTTQAAAPP